MNGSSGYLVTSILFLLVGTLSLLRVDFDALEWNAVVPGVLFLTVSCVYFYNYLRYKNKEKKG
ncbi:MAG: hypothetical protein AB8G86_23265 [Saprospiraceae bacterium]